LEAKLCVSKLKKNAIETDESARDSQFYLNAKTKHLATTKKMSKRKTIHLPLSPMRRNIAAKSLSRPHNRQFTIAI
jgi:hypothetical protein